MGKLTKKLAALALGLVMTVVTLEFALRVAGLLNVYRPSPSSRDSNEVRVVTLGESTTAPTGPPGADISWPAQLEKKLNEAGLGKRFRVLNIAVGASSTPFQVNSLIERFEELEPDIVVSMLGVNDRFVLKSVGDSHSAPLKIFGLIKWSKVFSNCADCFSVQSNGMERLNSMTEIRNLLLQADALKPLNRDKLIHLRRIFTALVERAKKQEGDDALVLRLVGFKVWELGGFANTKQSEKFTEEEEEIRKEAIKLAMEAWIEAWRLVRRDMASLSMYCHASIVDRNFPKCADVLREALSLGLTISSNVWTLALMGVGPEGLDSDLKEGLRRHGFEHQQHANTYESTREWYRTLARFLKQRNVLYFAMQYPTGRVEGLQQFFHESPPRQFQNFYETFYFKPGESAEVWNRRMEDEFREIVFVSNEEFSNLVSIQNRDQYYSDMFGLASGLNFGHTTQLGHQVIANNVFEAIKAALGSRGNTSVQTQ